MSDMRTAIAAFRTATDDLALAWAAEGAVQQGDPAAIVRFLRINQSIGQALTAADTLGALVAPPCAVIQGKPKRVTLDVGAFDETAIGLSLTVSGVVFRFVDAQHPAGPGEIAIDAFSASRSTAIAAPINQGVLEVKAIDDDGKIHLFGPPSMTVTTDAGPSVLVVELDPGSEAQCA